MASNENMDMFNLLQELNAQNIHSASITSQALGNLAEAINTQSIADISKNIETFNGDPKQFRKWWMSIDIQGRMNYSLPEDKLIMLIHNTSSGPVADYILRMRNEGMSFKDLSAGLKKNFSSVTDGDQAWSMFKHCRQRENETVTTYAERMCQLHSVAYESDKHPSAEAQQIFQNELINTFIAGLKDKDVKRALMRSKSKIFNEVLDRAVEEQNLSQRVEANERWSKRKEEDMDLSHVRQKRCPICNKFGHGAKECRKNPQNIRNTPQVNAISYPRANNRTMHHEPPRGQSFANGSQVSVPYNGTYSSPGPGTPHVTYATPAPGPSQGSFEGNQGNFPASR